MILIGDMLHSTYSYISQSYFTDYYSIEDCTKFNFYEMLWQTVGLSALALIHIYKEVDINIDMLIVERRGGVFMVGQSPL